MNQPYRSLSGVDSLPTSASVKTQTASATSTSTKSAKKYPHYLVQHNHLNRHARRKFNWAIRRGLTPLQAFML